MIKSTLNGIYSTSLDWRKWQRDYETGIWKMRGSRTGVRRLEYTCIGTVGMSLVGGLYFFVVYCRLY